MCLIHSKRLSPPDLLVLNRLIARLPQHHHLIDSLEEKRYQIEAGYSGELDVDRILHELEFPQETIILKDIILQTNPYYTTQLDTLIITPSRMILLEIKKYAGTVHFDEASGKTTRTSPSGKTYQYDCIIHQLIRAKEALRQWLSQKNINLPIEEVLVMANQRTIIPEMPVSVPLKYGKQLPRYIRELPSLPKAFSRAEIKSIAFGIKNSATSWQQVLGCEKYDINPSELRRGVLCLDCNHIMTRSQGRKWRCQGCGKYGNRDLEQSVKDWFLLVKPTFSNKECREFLSIKSKYSASVTLRESNLNRKGNPPKNFYLWDYKTPLFKK